MKALSSFLFFTVGALSMRSFGISTNPAVFNEPTNDAPKKKEKVNAKINEKNEITKEASKLTPSPSALGEDQDKNTITVGVKGMVCAFCASGIEKSFRALPEVDSVVVSMEKKFLKLTFKPGKSLSNEKISTILKDAGYEANFGS